MDVTKDGAVRTIERRRESYLQGPGIWWCPFCDHSNQDSATLQEDGTEMCGNTTRRYEDGPLLCGATVLDWEAATAPEQPAEVPFAEIKVAHKQRASGHKF